MINETLVAAAQYMDEHGKALGVNVDAEGRVCMMGALEAVGEDGVQVIGAVRRVRDYARAQGLSTTEITFISDFLLGEKAETVKFMLEAAEWEPKQ
jgi:hypothetical protein